MLPSVAYKRLNKLLWRNRLPKAKLIFVDDSVMPRCYGLTVDDEGDKDFIAPMIFLNAGDKHRGKTLVHEMLHLAEPQLPHSATFTTLVNSYWKFACKKLKGLGTV